MNDKRIVFIVNIAYFCLCEWEIFYTFALDFKIINRMKVFKRLVIMKKIKFILIALFTTLLMSCKDCIFCWDCGDLPQESYIHFDNAGKYNIVLACRSSYKDSVNHVYYPPYISEFNCTSYSKMTGIEILKSFKRRADEGRDIVNGDTIKKVYYLLFLKFGLVAARPQQLRLILHR